jgi:pilus assembly protein CpaD
MPFAHTPRMRKVSAIALGITLSLGLTACGGMPTNRQLESIKQPVVERTNYTFDVRTMPDGLAISEQQRLNGWFETMDLRYGDRITVDDPTLNPAVTTAISELAARYGLIVKGTAPTTAGAVGPGMARVVITRSVASVPGCPDWSTKSDMNYNNALSPGFGCGVNSNMAAMIADPQDLLTGRKGSSETLINTSNKAISTFRETPPTGAQGLMEASTRGGGN